MKKRFILILTMMFMVLSSASFAVSPIEDVVVHYDQEYKNLSIEGNTSFEAIAVFVYAPDASLEVFKTVFSVDGSFGTTFEKFNADQEGEYTVKLANYHGGTYYNYTFDGVAVEDDENEQPRPTPEEDPVDEPVSSIQPPAAVSKSPTVEAVKLQIAELLKKSVAEKVVSFEASSSENGVVGIGINNDVLNELEKNGLGLAVSGSGAVYRLPAAELSQAKLATMAGLEASQIKDVKLNIVVQKVDDKVEAQFKAIAEKQGFKLVAYPVEFKVTAEVTGTDGLVKNVDMNKFSTFVERVLELPEGVDPSDVKTGVVFNADGSFTSVPTTVFMNNGKWYAKLNSMTNSTYALISGDIKVTSVEGHWSKAIVNDMASRLVLEDVKGFSPDKAVSRSDFATYMVKALGLYRSGVLADSKFTDVTVSDSSALGVSIAHEWGIVSGYDDGTFRPASTITREEAMSMYSNAMDAISFKKGTVNALAEYKDVNSVSKWAVAHVEKVVGANIFNGKSDGQLLDPKGVLTHAEALAAIRNLLVAAGLVE